MRAFLETLIGWALGVLAWGFLTFLMLPFIYMFAEWNFDYSITNLEALRVFFIVPTMFWSGWVVLVEFNEWLKKENKK
jgi:hypothetical protein